MTPKKINAINNINFFIVFNFNGTNLRKKHEYNFSEMDHLTNYDNAINLAIYNSKTTAHSFRLHLDGMRPRTRKLSLYPE